MDKSKYEIILYYKYTSVPNPEAFMKWHKKVGEELGLKGRVLIAKEGINGTMEGLMENVEKYCELMHGISKTTDVEKFGDFSDMIFKRSAGTPDGSAFSKLKVKVREEVVSLGLEKVGDKDVNPNMTTGVHLKPEELKSWYMQGEDFEIIDMRNDYEFKVGHFKNSINPEMENFRDLPAIMPKLEKLKEESKKGKKILTVCTGGIRCEKASGYLVDKGFENVYQLDGGMHTYMEKYPGEDFLGALYVFDGRETMDFTTEKGLPREVVGKCDLCQATTEKYTNCANIECHKKMLCCDDCKNASLNKVQNLIKIHSNGIEDSGEIGSSDIAEKLKKIVDVARSYVFCSDKCKERVGVNEDVEKVTV